MENLLISLEHTSHSKQKNKFVLMQKKHKNGLKRVLNHQTPADIANADLYFIRQIGLQEHLSPTRSNGLSAMLRQMKLYALALLNK